jgi:tetratricopeptide (TPR) repeat protein
MLGGQNISHYQLGEKLGEGGMGVVFKAWDLKLSRHVALKFLSGSWADTAEQVTRFQQEAQAISALNHPNIATIYEIDEAEGHCFLALEYLPGGTLKMALAQLAAAGQQLSVEQGLEYALQLTEAVAHAHLHGVIHRDIKSANALFTESGAVKLTDFGLAKLARGINVTQTGSVMGTPAAMSPEQAQGQDTDERSDLFSLGVIMFELFSGELPFRGETSLAVLHQIVNVTAAPLGQRRSGIPVALERIVAKALERDREERYQSAADLAADLRALRRELLFGSAVQRSSLETVAIGTAPVRRRRGPPPKRTLAVAAACVVLVSAAWLAWPSVRAGTVSWFRAQSLPAEKRVAVLPFSTSDPLNQPFADGMSDMISYKLARLEQFQGSLLVVQADLVNDKERGAKTASAARANLGANLVIQGKVMRTGNRLEAVVTLVDTGNQAQLRSVKIEAPSSNLPQFRDRVMSNVTGMLDLAVTAQALEALRAGDTPDATAYSDYLEGRGYLQRRDRPENLTKAIAKFTQALERDQKYALAYAGIAEASLVRYRSLKDRKDLDRADAYGARAVDLNDQLEQVHITMGSIRAEEGLYEQAEAEFQEVLSLNAQNSEAYKGLARAYSSHQNLKAAEDTYKNVIYLRPKDWSSYNALGTFYFNHQRHQDSVSYFKQALDLTPDNFTVLANLGSAQLELGNIDGAIELFRKSLSVQESHPADFNLGNAYYLREDYRAAAQMFEKATVLAPERETYWGNLGNARRWADAELRSQAPAAYRKAIERAEAQASVNPRDPDVHAREAVYWAGLDDTAHSLQEIAKALEMAPNRGYVQYRAAIVYEQAQQHDNAFNAVKKALDLGYSLEEIQHAVPLKRLRETARFRQLLEQRASKSVTTGSSKK